MRFGNYEASIADFNKAIELKPDYATAYSNRGNTNADLGNYEAALADYDEAIELIQIMLVPITIAGTQIEILATTKLLC